MPKTLKDKYETHKLASLTERAKKAELALIEETRSVAMLLEAMDEQDLKRASDIIQKLQSLKGKGIGSLDAAIDKAIAELNKYTAGGPIAAAWTKIKSKVGIDNPLVKVMTFSNALETGFKQVPQILKNNIGELTPDMGDKSINDVVEDLDKRNTIAANLLKALKPAGVFGAFKKLPFIDNTKIFVQDMMTTPLKNLNTVVKQTTSGPQTAEIAADMKDIAQAQGGAETKGTLQGEPTKPGAQQTPTAPAAPATVTTGTAPPGEKPARPTTGGGLAQKIYTDIRSDFEGMDEKTVMAVLNALADNGKLKA